MQYKKLSVIIINNENTDECLENIKKQTYIDNIEITVINDLREINNLKINGDFISIIDGKDTISIDYYRAMIDKAVEEQADIVMSNAVVHYDDGSKKILNLLESSLKEAKGKECIKAYLNQEGLSFLWSIFGNKMFSKNLLEKTLDNIQNKETQIEDFYFFAVMFYYANKLAYIKNDYLFYTVNKKIEKDFNIKNKIINNFTYMIDFLKEKNIYEENEEKVNRWKKVYGNYLGEELIEGYDDVKGDTLYKIKTIWNDNLEKIKIAIADKKTKIVSFSIFDTLVVKPFFWSTDLFTFLDTYFREISNIETGIDFSKLRVRAEEAIRQKLTKTNNNIQEITLEEIYEEIKEETEIEENIINKMLEREIELELRFCSERKTAKELYDLAMSLGKKIICISDTYLSKKVIKEILNKNGYHEISNIYLSSEHKNTKQTGDLYSYVINDLKIDPKELVHIGNSYCADYKNSIEKEINGYFFARAIDSFNDENFTRNLSNIFKKELPDWQNNSNGLNFIGIRCMLAIVANKYFDNPFRTFNNNTDFNADPNLIGYYALGMHLFGIAKWLLEDTRNKKYDKIVFMARDGYWTMKAYEILSKLYSDAPRSDYLYISRKALMPVTLRNKLDFYKLVELIDISKHTPKTILKYFKGILINTENIENEYTNRHMDANKKFESQYEFFDFINIILEKFYNKEEHTRQIKALKQYFLDIFEGKSCAFDIGYSAKPEMYLSKLCEKPIDTYFINISNEEAYKHAEIGKFDLNLYLNYRPTITGVTRESLMSIADPSCVGYKIEEDNKVTPIFDENVMTYQERFVFDAMQNSSIEFIKDVVNTFKKDIDLLYYQRYYISLPHEMYIHSPSKLDQEILNGISFEDSVGLGDKISAIDEWNREMKMKNQQRNEKLFTIGSYEEELQKVYNSKRWRYMEKICKLFKRK